MKLNCRQNCLRGIQQSCLKSYLSRLMGKPTICIGENKGADQLRSNCEADQRLCFRYSDSTFPLLLKFQASSSLVCLYSLVCVEPVRKPHCWFSHEAAHLLLRQKGTADYQCCFRFRQPLFNSESRISNQAALASSHI